MDALILAGGAGERLVPLVPRFMKPLREVDGVPLVTHAIEFGRAMNVYVTAIVANQKNVDAIRSLVVERARVATVTQGEPTGIVDALRLGLRSIVGRRVVILCADNTFEPGGAWFRDQVGDDRSVIAVNNLVDPTGRLTRCVCGRLEPRRPDPTISARWIGPVVLDANRLRLAIEFGGGIEEVFNRAGAPFRTIEMNCRDHGVIDDR